MIKYLLNKNGWFRAEQIYAGHPNYADGIRGQKIKDINKRMEMIGEISKANSRHEPVKGMCSKYLSDAMRELYELERP